MVILQLKRSLERKKWQSGTQKHLSLISFPWKKRQV